jgi:hypothetical protein
MPLDPTGLLRIVDRLGHRRPQFRLGRLGGVRFENAELGLDDLGDRPVAQALAVGQRPSLAPEDQLRIAVDDLKQLGDQPALADSRHTDQRYELRAEVFANAIESAGQNIELPFSADELSAGTLLDVEAEAGSRCDRLPSRNRVRLPFRLDRRRLAVFNRLGRGAMGRLTDEDPSDRGGGLEPRRSVDDVPGSHPFSEVGPGAERHERLARVHSDPHLELERRVALVELDDRLTDRDRCANGPLRIVLVRYRGAEQRDDRVADELLDRAAMALELVPEASVVR